MVDLKELFEVGVHFGHKTSRWSPKMKPFIWGAKNKIHLIDISKTAILLERSSKYLKEAATTGKSILWVGTKKTAQPTIKKIGTTLNMPYVINRWIGGTLSNFSEIKKAITRFLHLKDVLKKSGTYYNKKELSALQKEIDRLEKTVGGITNLIYPPAAIIIVDAKKEHAAIKEALKLDIPVIAMVDTNTDPTGIHFIIPSNDDAPKAIEYIMNKLSVAVKEGRQEFEKKHQKELEEKQKEAAAKREVQKKEAEKKAAENARKAAEIAEKRAAIAKAKAEAEKVKRKIEKPKEIIPPTTKVIKEKAPEPSKIIEKKVMVEKKKAGPAPKVEKITMAVATKKKETTAETTKVGKTTESTTTSPKKSTSNAVVTKKEISTKKTPTTIKKSTPIKKGPKKPAVKKTTTSKSKHKVTKKR